MSCVVVDSEGRELASIADLIEATRTSRAIDGAVAVLNAEGVLLGRVVRGVGDTERAAHRWRQSRQRRQRRKVA